MEITVKPTTAINNTGILARSYQSGIESLVGSTPLIPLHRVVDGISPGVQILVKAEWFNPGGSIKDRPALNIIQTALNEGKLTSGKRLLDATS